VTIAGSSFISVAIWAERINGEMIDSKNNNLQNIL